MFGIGRQVKLVSAVMLSLCVLGASIASAETKGVLADPTADDIIRALTPAPKTRGLRPAATEAAKPTVALSIEFEFNSAGLTAQAKKVLGQLGLALSSEQLAASLFLVVGHTDAVGSANYNLALSERRAASVTKYLVAVHGIDGTRIRSAGKGESELLDSANPASGVNRRVEITNLGD